MTAPAAPTRSGLPTLSRELLAPAGAPALPERVLQFGQGNFLRGFVDWMVDSMNAQGLFGGRVVIVEATGEGRGDALLRQQGLYTTVLRGLRDGKRVDERRLVTCVSRVLNPYRDDSWLATAHQPEIRFVVSNTTERGLELDPADAFDARPSRSFPGKLTQWLHARWAHFAGDPRRSVVVLPCELVERNGALLRALVLELAEAWSLPAAFSDWLRDACVFAGTLVDRIVTGYPAEAGDAAGLWRELGYEDACLVVGEPYHAWVIEGPAALERELPLRAAGLNAVWTDDVRPYRECKVRILNGAHTAMAIVGRLAGLETVGECMRHPAIRTFVEELLEREIEPTVALPATEIAAFRRAVFERFRNPFLEHRLTSILLHTVSKFSTRLVPPLVELVEARGEPPPRLVSTLAALLHLYRPAPGGDSAAATSRETEWRDDAANFRRFAEAWNACGAEPTREELSGLATVLLSLRPLWGRDLASLHPRLASDVAVALERRLRGEVL